MMRSILSAAALAAALAASAGAADAQSLPSPAEAAFRATTLQISAHGETRLAPDMAVVNLGVSSEAATAAEASQMNATRMRAILAALSAARIAAADVQTSGLNLNARYGGEPQPRLIGYTASEMVSVRVHDLSKVSAVVDGAVTAGANQVNGISFAASDPTPAEDGAREAAVQALQAKAELYARAAGYRIARLVSLNEGGAAAPLPMNEIMVTAYRKGATPIAPGELTVRVEVGGVYELTR